MSIKNKAKDRDNNGRIKRKYTTKCSYCSMSQTPSWWVNMFMTRPKRRKNKEVCLAILKGEDPDSLVYPLGNKKPHEYYW